MQAHTNKGILAIISIGRQKISHAAQKYPIDLINDMF
jgi:hypothetical protein